MPVDLLLLTRLGETLYGVEIGHVQEIVEAPPTYYIPRAPACFSGAVNIRGGVLPVLDLPLYLGYAGDRRDGRVIVLAPHLCSMALKVTSVGRIVPYNRQSLLPPMERRTRDSFVKAMVEREGETVNLLDLPRLVESLEHIE